ncbi:MAG: hypothetical protein UU16_C0051G0011 [Candidatus Woesebacteria bacterium GW2011_GWA2_40_7]|uniref:Uncharacterized protein n=2 Tax=Candidatus Woeseibacteriota TaxID=1752722 RepID=A0A0G0LI43_9BACT|nr:MAG: hypothetical protein UT17_C0005G0003 [Candidatus Woesebacteria bacterium GW2011_GWB1_39_10]KKR71878.1 MAG: hypothetical protein UU16_C0051G0011 [Candidatus Woesebacteria bacterium GW2011_GWA2_40_7]
MKKIEDWLVNHPIPGLVILMIAMFFVIAALWVTMFLGGWAMAFVAQSDLNIIQASTVGTIVLVVLAVADSLTYTRWKRPATAQFWIQWAAAIMTVAVWLIVLLLPLLQ